jgi:ActR/RegA family two-component response regulator
MRDTPLRLLVISDVADDVQLLEEAFLEIQEIRFSRHWMRPVDRVYAVDAEEAMLVAGSGCFDVALLDLELGGDEGLRTFQLLHDFAPQLPIVILTSATEETLAMHLVKQGAQDYLLKPELDCVPLARTLIAAVARQRFAEAQRSFVLVDDVTGLWNERGFALVGRTQLGIAARCGLAAVIATAEVMDKSGGEVELLDAAAAFRDVLPSSALVARLGLRRFAAMIVPGQQEDAGRIEKELQGRMQLHWTTLRPQAGDDSAIQGDLIALCENVGVAARAGRHL